MSRSPRAEVGREEHSRQREQPLVQRPRGLFGKDRVGEMEEARRGRTTEARSHMQSAPLGKLCPCPQSHRGLGGCEAREFWDLIHARKDHLSPTWTSQWQQCSLLELGQDSPHPHPPTTHTHSVPDMHTAPYPWIPQTIPLQSTLGPYAFHLLASLFLSTSKPRTFLSSVPGTQNRAWHLIGVQ